jgi:2'-5' RNA ligase
MQAAEKQPLILTLKLDAGSQAFFDAQRQLYFPPKRNFLRAHLTLFHQLPDEAETYQILESIVFKRFELKVTAVMHIGAGVAYKISSEELSELHREVSDLFRTSLIPQDRQPFRPHISIQNKVMPETARKLLEQLSTDFKEFKISGVGLNLWRYLDGPWEWVKTYA